MSCPRLAAGLPLSNLVRLRHLGYDSNHPNGLLRLTRMGHMCACRTACTAGTAGTPDGKLDSLVCTLDVVSRRGGLALDARCTGYARGLAGARTRAQREGGAPPVRTAGGRSPRRRPWMGVIAITAPSSRVNVPLPPAPAQGSRRVAGAWR